MASPLPRRSPIELHKLVQECRAESSHHIGARIRTLESQRETDHAFLLKMAQYIEGVVKDTDAKEESFNTRLNEMDRNFREFTSGGFGF